MSGRVRRKLAVEAGERLAGSASDEPQCCALCGRPLGKRIEQHHIVPKSRGGRETVAVHPICHRTIHAALTNAELAGSHQGLAAVRIVPEIARFLRWIADKPPDFHARTRKRR
ncbi:HNH endonuclease [Stakelama pacifica]|uniref:HNH endonuclease n=1 Tax=Stakelama pacifica TaxID=517720 RepID=A0A4V3BU80_9SPHN|nr:HNH endonuclease [Stakelama pacifica]TDN85508.1 HNH endonuclease [Stakelama pacifica]GGO92441.1 hypothetical protein GCM10011329_09520 [Stakelama pacifica]